jgi:hypothetical protein
MTDDPIRKLPDGEELVLADEPPSTLEKAGDDPLGATVERRRRALAGRWSELRAPFERPAPPPHAQR